MVRRYHSDGMAITPIGFPARGRGKDGFLLRKEDAPSLSIADHDLPLAERTTLALCGWVQSVMLEGGNHMAVKQMYVYVRPSRYMKQSAGTSMHDLMTSLNADDHDFDALVLVSNNASRYSQDVAVVQRMCGRIFRNKNLAKLVHACHAPGHSARSNTIEKQWSVARWKLLGLEVLLEARDSGQHHRKGPSF